MRWLILSLALTAACVGASSAPAERSAERKALFIAWSAGTEEFRVDAARLEDDPELSRLWASDLVLVMVASYRAGGVAAIGEMHGRFERARRELIVMGALALEPLVEMVLVGNEIAARLALDVLVEGGERSAAPLLAKAMGGAPPSSRSRAVAGLGRLAFAAEHEAEVLGRLEGVLAEDPVWVCRAQAAHSLTARADRAGAIARVRTALSRGLGDPDEGVQDACCVSLMEIGDSGAVPALINHLERLVRSGAGLGRLRAAQTSLKGLTRTGGDLTPSAWRVLWSELRDSRQG